MTITRDNYEPYFLDFLDGNLAEDQIDQFLDFLEQNPDLKEELHGIESLKLDEEEIVYSGKNSLYKTGEDARKSSEIKMIAHLEGDMNDEERKAFEAYLSLHPELQKEYELFRKAKLTPDSAVRFPDKQKLYRKSRPVIVMNWVARAAAVVALVWGINAIYESQRSPVTSKTQPRTAQTIVKPEQSQVPEEKAPTETAIAENKSPVKEVKPEKTQPVVEKEQKHTEEKQVKSLDFPERETSTLAMMESRTALLEAELPTGQLIISPSVTTLPEAGGTKVITVDEFLAMQAKKAGEEGLLSARRLLRAGLGLASELSGERIVYREKNGKITSVDFDSKLLAFSIPIKKD